MTTVTAPAPTPEVKKVASSTPMPIGPHRVLNVPLLIVTLVAFVVLAGAAYFWHSLMVDNTADAFLMRADTLEKEGNWNSASRYLHQYLIVHPGDTEVRVRLAKIFDKSATELRHKPRAIELYFSAVGLKPDDLELRGRLIELLLEIGQYDPRRLVSAEKEASELLTRDSRNLVALRAMALTAYAGARTRTSTSGSMEDAVAKFTRGLKIHPGDIEMAKTLAHIYRNELKQPSQEERNELANATMQKLSEAAPDNPDAWLTVFLYRKLYGLPDVQDAIDKAVSLGPDNIDVLLAAGENALTSAVQARQTERWDDVTTYFNQAEKYYQRVIDLEPKKERGYLGLGQAKLLNERAGEAIITWQEGLKHCGAENLDLNMQIVRTQIILGQLDSVEKTLDLLDLEFEKLGPRLTQAQAAMAHNMVKYMRGKLHFGRGEYRESIKLLEAVVSEMTALTTNQATKRSIAEFFDAAMTLGKAYGATGQWDLAAKQFVIATKLKPEDDEAKRQASSALVHAGQHTEALKYMSDLKSEGTDTLGIWLAKAETELRRQLARPLAERNWEELHAMLSKPPEALRRSWQLKLLESDYILARGGEKASETALRFLAAAEKLHPDAPDLYQKLTLIYQRLGKPEEADRALKKLGLLDAGSLRYSLVNAELLTLRGDFAAAEKLLRDAMQPLAEAQQAPLRYTLFRLYLQRGDAVAARKELEGLQKQLPEDANLVYQLAELTLEMADFEGVKRWADELKKLDGEDSERWRYFAAERLVNLSKDDKDPQLAQATDLQKHIEAHRSSWPQGHLLKGDIALKSNDIDGAIKAYKAAISQGEARVGIYERLIQMLYVAKQYDDAQKYLDQLQDFVLQSQKLMMIDEQLSNIKGDRHRARELAEKGTRLNPKDPNAWVRLGQAWLAEDEKEKAEEAFRKSVEVAPTNVQAWNGLISYLLRGGRTSDAIEALNQLQNSTAEMDPLQKDLFLGRANELLGRRDEAGKFFEAALKRKPEDLNIQIDVAEFYRRGGKDSSAKELMRAAYKQNPKDDRVRVRLAESLIQGSEAEKEEAVSLLESAAVGANATPANRRILAQFLAQRGIDYRKKAIELYESLVANESEREPQDQIRLAYLYELDRRIEPAMRELTSLATAPDADPAYLVMLIEFQLRHNMAVAATNHVKELSKLEPNSFRTLNIQTRWLKAQGRNKDIEPFVEHFARNRQKEIDNPQQEALVMLNIGRIYNAVGMHEQALRWFQELHALNPKAYRPLASALTAVGRSEDAIKLAINKGADNANLREAVDVVAETLTSGKSSPNDYKLAQGMLERAHQQFGESIPMLFTLALIHASQQETDEAISLYKQILERSPQEVATLNNLAYVLLDVPGRTDEALGYINRAIDIEGSNAALLDTKGMLLLETQPAQALKLFEEATSVPSTDPRYLFHLAVGYQRTGATAKARVSLASAQDLGLQDQLLTGTEQRLLNELNKAL